ncbi:MAG: hypothetical protein JW863_17600 [Chitinispirillaceae bacterium]|nr:hypothetical protein [Chitinispirillaceae bacterium]
MNQYKKIFQLPVLVCALVAIIVCCSKQKTEQQIQNDQPEATIAPGADSAETASAVPVESEERNPPVAAPQENEAQTGVTDSTTPQPKATPEKKDYVASIGNLDDLNAIVEGTPGKLLVFDLYADWCRPCKILAPLYDSLAVSHEKKANFYRVDVQNNPDIAAAFGVRGIPFVVFMKDKKVVHALTGLNPKESYERVLTTCGAAVSVEECTDKLNKPL